MGERLIGWLYRRYPALVGDRILVIQEAKSLKQILKKYKPTFSVAYIRKFPKETLMKFYLKSNDKILYLRWIKKLSGYFSGKPDLISVSLRNLTAFYD